MTQVHATNSRYPCCGNIARFRTYEVEDPDEVVTRQCPTCRTRYTVLRTVVVEHGGERVDTLTWVREEH